MSKRRTMVMGDWANAAINLVIGIFLGVAAAGGLTGLATTAFWPLAFVIVILVAGAFVFERVIDGLMDRLFPGWVRPARNPPALGRAPIARLPSLPAGMVLGVSLSRLGMADTIPRTL